MAKSKQQSIEVAGVAITVDAVDAERIMSREWAVFSGESITSFTNGSELLGNFILGLPMTVFIEHVSKADVFNYTKRNLKPYVNRRVAREHR